MECGYISSQSENMSVPQSHVVDQGTIPKGPGSEVMGHIPVRTIMPKDKEGCGILKLSQAVVGMSMPKELKLARSKPEKV